MRIGILGSGQLARMMILAGLPMGLTFTTYGPDAHSTMGEYAPHVVGDYDDAAAVAAFAKSVDVVTYEHENLPADLLKQVEQAATLRPCSNVIAQVQDRLFEKQLFVELGIPTNAFQVIDSNDDLRAAAQALGFPFIVKSRRNGYDGKHQHRINTPEQLEALIQSHSLSDCLAEGFVDFDREISIVAVRSASGQSAFYDVCQNHHESGILRSTINCPNDASFDALCLHAMRLLEAMDYVGVLAIEFFDCNGALYANEVAPRVHNSGHWTIEGAYTSQFANHVRAVAGLPLGSCRSSALVRMDNCIGTMPSLNDVLQNPFSHRHDYMKSPRPGRKLGHKTTFRKDEE